jgi:RsiW-degrading membrane proteinase PrsW (M82 family)
MTSAATGAPLLTQRQSLTLVRVTAMLACAFGAAVLSWQFARFVVVFTGPALLALVLEIPLVVVGFLLARLLRPMRAPDLIWSAAATIWGGTAAAGCALLANKGLIGLWAKGAGPQFAASWSASLSAPLNEEILKVCGVIMIVLAAPRIILGPLDGMIIGALVGLGFQATENVTYGLNSIVLAGGTDPGRTVTASALVRIGLTALGSHWTMTAVAGAGVGYIVALVRGSARGSLLRALGCLLLAMAMHVLFDAPRLAIVVKVGANFAIVAVLYLLLSNAYLTGAQRALADLAAAGRISPDESASLLSRLRRRRGLAAATSSERGLIAARQQALLAEVERIAA